MPPSYVILTGGVQTTSWFYGPSLHRLSGSRSDAGQPSALSLEYNLKGDLVSITATAYFGELDLKNLPPAVDKVAHETVGTYSGKMNDSLTMNEMERVGLEPLTLKIVAAQSDNSGVPLLHNDAPSLEASLAPRDQYGWALTVHNSSASAVKALRLGVSSGGSGEAEEMHAGPSRELVAARGTNQFQVSIGSNGRMVNGAYVKGSPAEELELQVAVFADGSYEGERQYAMGLAATLIGEQVQRQRIMSGAAPILEEIQNDARVGVEHMRAFADQLSTQPEPKMIDELQSWFPDLTKEELTDAQRKFSIGMEDQKNEFQRNLNGFRGNVKISPVQFTDWWAVTYKAN
jgi:hypothetical protein